jgi:hypothetical protein
MLHRRLIPARTNESVSANWYDNMMRTKLVPAGAEFISAWDVFCNAEGCLARLGDEASDITASDVIHLTEKGSIFLVQSIIDRVLHGKTARAGSATH